MHVAVREVLTLSQRSFAGAGFSEGVADAKAGAIWWTEAYRRTGFSTLHALIEDLSEYDTARLTLTERSDQMAVVDGDGQPSIVSSTQALDFACANANRHGVGIAYATTCEDDPSRSALGYLAHKAVERGYLSVVVDTDATGASTTVLGTPDEPRPLLVEIELDAPAETYVELLEAIEAGVHRREEYPLAQTFFTGEGPERYSTADTRMLDRLVRRAIEPTDPERFDGIPGYVVVCIDPAHPLHSGAVHGVVDQCIADREDDFTQVFDPQTVQDRIARLTEDAIEIELDVWRDIFDASHEILAPAFEGSERGAGMDLDEM